MTCRLRRNDGKLIPVSVFSVILPNGSAMAFIEDITERKEWEKRLEKNEQELRNSEEKFRTIFDRAALGITTTGLDGRPVDFNQRYLEMVGYAPEEIKKMNFEEFTHPDDVARNQVLFESIKAGAVESYELEKRYIRKNGECIWVHLFTNRLLDSFGQPERVLTIVEDITERKRFAETLRNSEEQYSKLVAAIPDFVIRTDMSGNIILVNETGLKRGGYRLDEIAGHNLLSFVAPEDIEKSIKNIERMVEGMLGPVEYRLIMKNGKKVLFEVNGDVLRTSDGSPTGLVFVCRDMTERRQLESRLREANRKLMINDSITRHDTVNKLMALQGYIDLMRMGRDDVKELDRLNRMDQIVGFLREQVNVTKEYQNIGVEDPAWQSVREVCMRAASQTHLGNVTLDVDVGDLQILADPLLFKVFYNLMDNSLRHGIKVSHIEVKEDHTENGTRIILSDDGVGISLDEKTNLFREGYGKVHGLGLFLSKEILDITGMTITETGELGKGARFEITVPEGSYRNGQDAPVG
jgi:PAS domain S-box-containing protein